MLDDNIALSNSSKNYSFNNMNKTASNKKQISNNQNRTFILKNLIMKNDIQNLRYNHNKNISINSNDNTKKNNLNKKNIYIEYGDDDDIIDERKSVPKFSRSYFYVDWNSNKKTEQFQQKIRLVKKENPLNLMHMNLNKQIPSLDEYKKRYRSKQNLTANSNSSYYSMINNKKYNNIKEKHKGDLKEKNNFIYHKNKKKVNEKFKNNKWINISNININKFPNNNYTYVTIIKNPENKKINNNNISQNSFSHRNKLGVYKPIFTAKSFNTQNFKKITTDLIKKKEINTNKNL